MSTFKNIQKKNVWSLCKFKFFKKSLFFFKIVKFLTVLSFYLQPRLTKMLCRTKLVSARFKRGKHFRMTTCYICRSSFNEGLFAPEERYRDCSFQICSLKCQKVRFSLTLKTTLLSFPAGVATDKLKKRHFIASVAFLSLFLGTDKNYKNQF